MENAPKLKPKISGITAIFMIVLALLFDAVQFLLTLSVFLIPFSYLATGLALCIFGVWFAILRVNYFSGKKSGAKMFSVFASSIVELVPVIDAVPGITAGVIGIIVSSRAEDMALKNAKNPVVSKHVNSSGASRHTSANDNEFYEDLREAA